MNVLFIASVAVVAAEPAQGRKLFMDTLGLRLEDGELPLALAVWNVIPSCGLRAFNWGH